MRQCKNDLKVKKNLRPKIIQVGKVSYFSEPLASQIVDENVLYNFQIPIVNSPLTPSYQCFYDQVVDGNVTLTNFCSLITNFTFNTSTAEINFTPDFFQSGDYEFKILLSSSDGNTEAYVFTLLVNNVNRSPSLNAIANTKYLIEYSFPDINASDGGDDQDIDLENITYSCLYDTAIDATVSSGASTCASISGLSFDSTTGILSGAAQSSATYEMKITGADPLGMSPSQIFTFEAFLNDIGSFGGRPKRTVKSGSYLYTTNCLGLQVTDITTPAAPTFVYFVETLGCSYDIVVDGNYLYVTLQDKGLVIFDITNPLSPTIISHFSSTYNLTLIKKSGNYIYVLASSYGMLIIDVTAPTLPIYVSSIDLTAEFMGAFNPFGMDISGNTVYVVSNSSPVVSVDITNKLAPVFLNSTGFTWNYSVSVIGPNILVSSFRNFSSLDMTDPAVFIPRSQISPDFDDNTNHTNKSWFSRGPRSAA